MFEDLVKFCRNFRTPHTTRGIQIQLENDIAYVTNKVGSIFYRLQFKEKLGTGTFSAFQATPNAKKIERRDGKVLFERKEGTEKRRMFLGEKRAFGEIVERVLNKYTKTPNFQLNPSFLENLDNDIPFTRFIVNEKNLIIQQTRSDGSMKKEDIIPSGLRINPISADVSIFTSDIFGFKDNVIGKIGLFLETKTPLSLTCRMRFGADVKGIIGYVVYEV